MFNSDLVKEVLNQILNASITVQKRVGSIKSQERTLHHREEQDYPQRRTRLKNKQILSTVVTDHSVTKSFRTPHQRGRQDIVKRKTRLLNKFE